MHVFKKIWTALSSRLLNWLVINANTRIKISFTHGEWLFMVLQQIFSSVPCRIFLCSCRNRLINQNTFIPGYQNYKLYIFELIMVVWLLDLKLVFNLSPSKVLTELNIWKQKVTLLVVSKKVFVGEKRRTTTLASDLQLLSLDTNWSKFLKLTFVEEVTVCSARK